MTPKNIAKVIKWFPHILVGTLILAFIGMVLFIGPFISLWDKLMTEDYYTWGEFFKSIGKDELGVYAICFSSSALWWWLALVVLN